MDVKKYILYKHTSPNGKVYIGITCQSIAKRWGKGGVRYKSHPFFWNAIQKYGWDNFKHEIILTELSKDEACEKERDFIAKYRSNESCFGYNLTTGGESGFEFNPEIIRKQSEALKLKWQDQQYREKVSRSCGCKGSHWSLSEETKEKMRKPKSEETKKKMRKPKSVEARLKMSEAKRRYFDSMTTEQRKEIFGTHSKRKHETANS